MNNPDRTYDLLMGVHAMDSGDLRALRVMKGTPGFVDHGRAGTWMLVAGFVVLGLLSAWALDALSGSRLVGVVIGLWIAVNGTMLAFVMEAWKSRHVPQRVMALRG